MTIPYIQPLNTYPNIRILDKLPKEGSENEVVYCKSDKSLYIHDGINYVSVELILYTKSLYLFRYCRKLKFKI